MDFRKKPSVQKLWREKPVFTHFRDQRRAETILVGQVLLERLAIGSHRRKTSEIGHCLPSTHSGYEASYTHAQYIQA